MHPDPNLSRCDAPAEAGDVAEAAEAAEEFYGVERLLGRRGIGRNVKYLVRWSGYGKDHDSWEAAANICDPALVRAFEADERRLGRGGTARRGSDAGAVKQHQPPGHWLCRRAATTLW